MATCAWIDYLRSFATDSPLYLSVCFFFFLKKSLFLVMNFQGDYNSPDRTQNLSDLSKTLSDSSGVSRNLSSLSKNSCLEFCSEEKISPVKPNKFLVLSGELYSPCEFYFWKFPLPV